MTDCIFCNIVSGKLPAYKVYEDDEYLAFLDIFPVVAGQTLIVPKKHYRWVYDVPEFGDYWSVAQKVAKAQLTALAAPTVLFLTAGFQVPHAHIHVLPAPPKSKGEFLPGIESAKRIKITPEQLKEISEKIRFALR